MSSIPYQLLCEFSALLNLMISIQRRRDKFLKPFKQILRSSSPVTGAASGGSQAGLIAQVRILFSWLHSY